MSAAKPGRTNTDIEQHYFEKFRAAYPLPAGTLSYGDKPDVILNGERQVGIEITNFFLQEGSCCKSEQKQRPLRAKAVCKAQELYRAAGGRGIELTIEFDASNPIIGDRKGRLPRELAELARQNDSRPSGPLEKSLFRDIPEIRSVYVNTQEYQDAVWRPIGVYNVQLMSEAKLRCIVRGKESKSANYKRCDAYWLLVVVDGMDSAQEQEIREDDLHIASDVFERIIIYKPGFEHIVEVKA